MQVMYLLFIFLESLDEMTKFVCDLFGEIVNKKVREPSWPEHPYGPDQLRKRVLVVPVKDLRRLQLLWPCYDLHKYWESRVSFLQACYISIVLVYVGCHAESVVGGGSSHADAAVGVWVSC